MENEKSLTESLIETVNENQDANFCFLVIGKEDGEKVKGASYICGNSKPIATTILETFDKSPQIGKSFEKYRLLKMVGLVSEFLEEDSK